MATFQEMKAKYETPVNRGFVGNILSSLTQPFRRAYESAKYAASAPGGYKPMFDSSSIEDIDAAINEPTKQVLKSIATAGSFLVPTGAAKGAATVGSRIGTAALRGAGAGTLGGYGYSKEGEELKGALSGGLTGGLFAGALQGIGEVSKGIKAAKISNKLDDMADELQASALKKDIGIAPTTKQGKNILPKQISEKASSMGVKIKSPEDLKSFAQALYESNANVANQAAQQLDDLGRVIDITEIKRPLLEQLAKTKSPELQAPIQKVIDSIDNATGGSNAISAGDLLNLRREWGKLGNWNPFMDPAATTTAGAFEAAYMRANDLLDDAFKGAGITGFKDANKAISLSIDADNWAERAIANKSNRPLWNDMTQDAAIAATVFGGGGPGAAAGAVGSKVAQRYAEPIAEKALRGVSKVTSGLGALPQVLQPLVTAGQRAIPAIPGINQGISEGRQIQQPQQQLPQGVNNQGISALNLMLAQEVLNGNISATEANAVLSLLGMDQGGATGKMTESQRDYQLAAEAMEQAYGVLEQAGGAGKLATLGGNIAGFFGSTSASSEYRAALDTATAFLRKALIGSGQSEAELKNLNLPKPTDEPKIAKQKIMTLIPLLRARAGLQQY